ncbi:hypothetical protein C8Q78DRAFT_178318 [Trametes maxima]|nr:hypothetical protein C8Q78DRAFT_178318 [Trametes maxima]
MHRVFASAIVLWPTQILGPAQRRPVPGLARLARIMATVAIDHYHSARQKIHRMAGAGIFSVIQPHLVYLGALQECVDTLVGAPIYAICYPLELLEDLELNAPSGHHILRCLRRVGTQAFVDAIESIKYDAIVILKFFSPPWKYPEALARLDHSRAKGEGVKEGAPAATPDPPPEGTYTV